MRVIRRRNNLNQEAALSYWQVSEESNLQIYTIYMHISARCPVYCAALGLAPVASLRKFLVFKRHPNESLRARGIYMQHF